MARHLLIPDPGDPTFVVSHGKVYEGRCLKVSLDINEVELDIDGHRVPFLLEEVQFVSCPAEVA